MYNNKELSTENIRARMIKNAARIWGMESEDIEATFDPLVTMLIEACAYELSRINNEIHDTQSRVLEQLAQVLSPDVFTGPRPASAIAHARSSEAESLLNKEVQFYVQQKIINAEQKEISKDIYFSPLRKFRIFDAGLKYLATGKTLYEFKNPSFKQVAEGSAIGMLKPYEVWLGIEINSKIKTPDNFVFYFDWKNDPERNNHLNLLPLVKWYCNNRELKAVRGIQQEGNAQLDSQSISGQYDVSWRTEHFIESIHAPNFYTLSAGEDTDVQSGLSKYPNDFEQVFPVKMLEKMDGDLLWLKLVFPGAFRLSALNDLYVSMNAFPVINRRLNKITYQLRSSLNIVPLRCDDYFFDLVNIQNSEGAYFQSNPLESGFRNEAGFYTLRYGGIERFDKRSATEFLQIVTDLLRDESASFSSLGNEFLSTYINQINQSLAMIENRLNTKGESAKPSHFIIINPLKQNENVFIKFWSTSANEGNLVKAGARLNISSGGDVRSASLMLLSSCLGGKKPLNENERITAFRRSILTHDRVVTQEDIAAFCYHELGNLISSVEVKRNWELSPLPNRGFIRIVEAHVFPGTTERISGEQWDELLPELEARINEASNKLIPIRVKVVSAD